jgi:hypothetical protein
LGCSTSAALAYFLLQTTSAGLAAYNTSLYAFALAMYDVEYHVLTMPRCFQSRLNESSWTDRTFGRLRRRPVLFYGLLVALAIPITRFAWLGLGPRLPASAGSGTVGYRMLISVFDGLFVFHYIIEARIWRFREPFYRRSLLSLYLGKAAPTPAVADRPLFQVLNSHSELGQVMGPV